MSVLRLIVASVVTLIWAATWIVALLTSDYNGVGTVTPVMLLVAGYLFAQEWRELKRGNGKKKRRDD